MKLRNFANKFLLVTLMLLLVLGNFTLPNHVDVYRLTTAEADTTELTALTKSYYFDTFNKNQPTNKSIYEELGIIAYNNDLMETSASQKLNDVVVAVVDTGLDINQPVFEGRVLSEYAMDFSEGIPTATTNNWNMDYNGHGTHVAGIIADATLSNVKILPIKIFNDVGEEGDNLAFVNATLYLRALKTGVRTQLYRSTGDNTFTLTKEYYPQTEEEFRMDNLVAANFSLGSRGYLMSNPGDSYNTYKDFYQNLIDYGLLQPGILPIVAAGNRSDEPKNKACYALPGACSGVLTVSWYNNNESDYALAETSFFNDNVSLAAPGSDIWSACSSFMTKTFIRKTPDGRKYYKTGSVSYQERGEMKLSECDVVEIDDVDYYRSSGTSMATPFVTACYAMLMSDPRKKAAADYGLTRFDPTAENSDDGQYVNIQHKALLAAAATHGWNTSDEYNIQFGYGTVVVDCFVPEAGSVATLEEIKYQPLVNTTKNTATLPNLKKYLSTNEPIDWFRVCIILCIAVLIIWGVKLFRGYFTNIVRRKTTNDDNEQQ